MIHYATKVAYESRFKRARVGAVILRGSRIISSGCNRIGYTSLLRNRNYPESVHAEQAAIIKLLRRNSRSLIGSTMYVSRISSSGHVRLAKPCEVCMKIIESVGIRKVIYTTNE